MGYLRSGALRTLHPTCCMLYAVCYRLHATTYTHTVHSPHPLCPRQYHVHNSSNTKFKTATPCMTFQTPNSKVSHYPSPPQIMVWRATVNADNSRTSVFLSIDQPGVEGAVWGGDDECLESSACCSRLYLRALRSVMSVCVCISDIRGL